MNMSCLWMKLAGLRSRPKANPSKDQPQADSETAKTRPSICYAMRLGQSLLVSRPVVSAWL